MSLAEVSVKRPIFISCVVFLMLAVGAYSTQKLGVDLFPDVTFPVVTVTTPYLGAAPSEIETLISKPIEDELSSLSGIKRLSSTSQEGVSTVVVQFTLETDIRYAEQQVRDRVSSVRRTLPKDIEEPVIRRIDPSDQPIMLMAVKGDLAPPDLFDVADNVIRPKLEQADKVGLVQLQGGRKREIHVYLDQIKLKQREISASQVSSRLAAAGEDIPIGKVDEGKRETVFRSVGRFTSLPQISSTIVNFYGSDVPTVISDVAKVEDALKDETSRAYFNGEPALQLQIYKQSGSNTIEVANRVRKQMDAANELLKTRPGNVHVEMIRDGSVYIQNNVTDVKESILFGIALAVIVVYLFLGNGRSTIITGLALPNSMLGAFILMWAAGYTINLMTLLALSLSVGLLVDDAIVVRENIFRHLEMGKSALKAALEGTGEVRLAVIATTLTVIAVFGPVGFLKGMVGQFFKQFGITVCFAMMISLFDALTIAPMLSTYFAGSSHKKKKSAIYRYTLGVVLGAFNRFQDALEDFYEGLLRRTVNHPLISLLVSFIIAAACFATVAKVPKTFLPPQDNGEFTVALDLPPGTSLAAMDAMTKKIDGVIRGNREVELTSYSVGNQYGEANTADMYVHLIPAKARTLNTSQVKEKIREQLKEYAEANPKVKDFDAVGGGMRPFNLNIIGTDQDLLEKHARGVFEELRRHPGLKDVDINSKPGKPELQVIMDQKKGEALGVSNASMGAELRTLIEGSTPAKFRIGGDEYDIRVRLQEDQRNLRERFATTYVPNINFNLIRLPDVAKPTDTVGPAKITRQDRGRYIQISADITPGAGLGNIMQDIVKMFETTQKLPTGLSYGFLGQAEDFKELMENMLVALGFGILFIYLVLSSLYESFITPFTIMLALPLAICGSMLALFLAHQSVNIFSIIGLILLLGVATKNSILLVDYTNQLIQQGLDRPSAIIKAGRTRLRPILMTTMALIAGTVPVALGLNEASRQRTSMGVAIIGGLVSSTFLTLIVIPAAFCFVDDFRQWVNKIFARVRGESVTLDVAENLKG